MAVGETHGKNAHRTPALKGPNDVCHQLERLRRVAGRFMVWPLQGRIGSVTLFRGLAPTAIHVHPLRGWGMAGAPRREQLELLKLAQKFGSEERHGVFS
jgi:hypothetical protein